MNRIAPGLSFVALLGCYGRPTDPEPSEQANDVTSSPADRVPVPHDPLEILKVSNAYGIHVSLWTSAVKGQRDVDEQVLVMEDDRERKVIFVDDRHLSGTQRSYLLRTYDGVVFVSLQTVGVEAHELRQRFSWDTHYLTLVADGERFERITPVD